jgi:hypothetical protein
LVAFSRYRFGDRQLVSFDSEVRKTSVQQNDANFGSGTLAGGQAMPLFCCSKCGCVEDTALCRYWSARLRRMPPLCSACDPAIARWHGEFPQQSAEAEAWVTDQHGMLLWNRGEVEDWVGTPIQILGKVATPPFPGDKLPLLPEKEEAPGRLTAGA